MISQQKASTNAVACQEWSGLLDRFSSTGSQWRSVLSWRLLLSSGLNLDCHSKVHATCHSVMSKKRYLGWDEEMKASTKMMLGVPGRGARAPHFDAERSAHTALSRMREEQLFCDVTLRLDDGAALSAHRVVLAAGSDYFRAAFTCALGRRTDNGVPAEVSLSGVSLAAGRCLLAFLYERRLALSGDSVHELLVLADFLGVVDLLALCCDFLANALTPDNCISTLRFARCYKDARCRALADTAYTFLMVSFGTVVDRSAELLALPVDELDLLLATDELNLASEEQVWNCVVRWMGADKESRPQHMLRLLQRVRFALLPPEFFMRQVRHHPWLADTEDTRRFVSETLRTVCGLSEQAETDAHARARMSQQTLFAMGGWSGPRPTDVVEVYDCRRDEWRECPDAVDPLGPRAYHGAAALGARILVVGGFDGKHEYYSSCRWFDARTRRWSDAGAMHYRRCYVSVAVVGETVFALGGYDGQFRHNTAERYCARANQWHLIAPMHEQRSDACAATLDGKVYVAGGFDGLECIASCEMFDPTTNQWTLLRPMLARRSGVSCIAHRGALYALGGFNGESRLASCERLDPATGAWQPVAEMLFARSNFGCELLDGRIHVFGGFNGSSTCPDTECLDTEGDCWLPRAYMHLHRSALSTVALYALPNRSEYFECMSDPTRARILELMCDWRDKTDAPPTECRTRPEGGATASGRGLAGCCGDR